VSCDKWEYEHTSVRHVRFVCCLLVHNCLDMKATECSLSASYFMYVHVRTVLNRSQPQATEKVCTYTNHMIIPWHSNVNVSLSHATYVSAQLNGL
jgi:hypothetical protein